MPPISLQVLVCVVYSLHRQPTCSAGSHGKGLLLVHRNARVTRERSNSCHAMILQCHRQSSLHGQVVRSLLTNRHAGKPVAASIANDVIDLKRLLLCRLWRRTWRSSSMMCIRLVSRVLHCQRGRLPPSGQFKPFMTLVPSVQDQAVRCDAATAGTSPCTCMSWLAYACRSCDASWCFSV